LESILEGPLKDFKSNNSMEFAVAQNSFAEGTSRVCYWGVCREIGSNVWEHVVFKVFKSQPQIYTPYFDELEKSVTAAFLAREYNRVKKPELEVEFIIPRVLEAKDGKYYNIESVLPDPTNWKRYNDNKGIWMDREGDNTLKDFTRWQDEFSKGRLLVADLQGVKLQTKFLLTDPAILCSDVRRFGNTNLGKHFIDATVKPLLSQSRL